MTRCCQCEPYPCRFQTPNKHTAIRILLKELHAAIAHLFVHLPSISHWLIPSKRIEQLADNVMVVREDDELPNAVGLEYFFDVFNDIRHLRQCRIVSSLCKVWKKNKRFLKSFNIGFVVESGLFERFMFRIGHCLQGRQYNELPNLLRQVG